MASENIWFSMDIFGTKQKTNKIGSKLKELERAKYLLPDKTTFLFEVLFWNAWIDPLGGETTKHITWIGTSCFIVFESPKKVTST